MTYHLDDLYTTSGTAKLWACWTSTVTKFQSESFYSWEQDNEPLYDLEERTHLLWEQLGYATSSTNAMVLLVSSNAVVSPCSSNIFTTVSGLTKALPKVINAPIIVEVASFGNLGTLHLDGISFGPNGSLEFVNRNYYWSKNSSVSPLVSRTHVTTGPHGTYENIIKSVSCLNTDGDAYPFFTTSAGGTPSSLVTMGPIFSSTSPNIDARIASNFTPVFTYQPFKVSSANTDFTRTSIGFKTGNVTVNGSVLNISSTPFEEGATTEVSLYDPSSFDQTFLSNRFYREASTSAAVNLLGYNNYFEKIVIRNCNGPIYLRGFLVEGEGTRSIGIDCKGSNLYLEDISIDRFISRGLRAVDSDINIYKSFVVNRCYGIDSGVRDSGEWLTNITNVEVPDDRTCGVETINCAVEFNNQASRYASILDSTNPWYGAQNCVVAITRNSTGWRAENTQLVCENSRFSVDTNSTENTSSLTVLVFEGNANVGLELNNSHAHLENRIEVLANTRGVLAKNSELSVEEFNFEMNHLYGLKLVNSKFLYGIKAVESNSRWDLADLSYYAGLTDARFSYSFNRNGQHVVGVNSIFDVLSTSAMPDRYGRLYAVSAAGADASDNPLPAFEFKDGSFARLIHPTISRPNNSNTVCKGIAVAAFNNSEVMLLGTDRSIGTIFGTFYSTPLEGDFSYSQTRYVAAVYAKNGSTIRLRGPNLITTYAVPVLAEDNSNIILEPHKTLDGILDVSGFELSAPKNHTMIELQGTKSCLVADRASNIIMEDLGDYTVHWKDSTAGVKILSAVNYDTSSGGFNTSLYTSAGYVQLYANPNDSNDYATNGAAAGLSRVPANASVKGSGPYYLFVNYRPTNSYDMSAVTNGGMALRALNNSNVKVRNVNFPCGWWNASSIIYDSSAADGVCSRFHIWNIANDSTLKASYLSVSGLYPADAGYHGPSAVWVSGSGSIAYGMPSSTPDTSTLSILDQFGLGGTTLYGQTSWENQGPFRLYVSVDSLGTAMRHPGSIPGVAYQVWAQGYQVSSNLEPFDVSLSSVYGKLLRYSNGTVTPSGYYYGDEMVSVNPANIMLDESASNSFANAKNGATKSSRKPQICTIYNTTTDATGEAKTNSIQAFGRGFKSANIFDIMEDS